VSVLKGCDKTIELLHAHDSAVNVRKLFFVVIQQTACHAEKMVCSGVARVVIENISAQVNESHLNHFFRLYCIAAIVS
jgi:hypothetical protein